MINLTNGPLDLAASPSPLSGLNNTGVRKVEFMSFRRRVFIPLLPSSLAFPTASPNFD